MIVFLRKVITTMTLLLVCSGFFGESSAADGWKNRPYLNLGGGSGLAKYTQGSGSEWGALVGSEAGFRYRQRDGSLEGKTRVSGQAALGIGAMGLETRVGSFLGYRRFLWGVEIGVDVFRNNFSGQAVSIVDSLGAELPVSLKIGPNLIQGVATVAPAYLSDPERRVAWTGEEWGIGHEFRWSVGLEIGLPIVGVSIAYEEKVVAGGTVQGILFGLEL